MDLPLDLGRHCIETEIRRIYNRSLSEYFKQGADTKRIEKRIDLLKRALEGLDFPRLRTTYPELAGKTGAAISLTLSEDDRIRIRIGESTVDPLN